MEALSRLKDQRVAGLTGLIVCLLMALVLHFSRTAEALSRNVLDYQFNLLPRFEARPLKNDVVIVGIDEASYKAIREPFALWHPYLGKFLEAMAIAKPAVLGLDIVLPERSYDFLVPGYDQSLLRGLRAAGAQTRLVLAQTAEASGEFRNVYEPFVAASGGDALASVTVCPDSDGVVRRFDPARCMVNARGTTLVEKMAQLMGATRISPGLVNFGVGAQFEYIPFTQVLAWEAQGDADQLKRAFAGKPVLLGLVSPPAERVNSPVPLAAWDPLRHRVPAVLMQAQMLRSILDGGMIRDVSANAVLLLALLAALLWLGRSGWLKLAALLVFPFAVLLGSTLLLGGGFFVPTGGILLAGTFACVARFAYDGAREVKRRNWLRGTFGSYVSEDVLQEIVAGKIHSGLQATRSRVCILFANIHGFTARSEARPPEEVVSVLNDYFSEMAVAIRQHGGTVDKFIGDSIMAFFGAPQALECPEKNALEAAQEMLLRMRHVNARLREQGVSPIELGIAVHADDVVIGHIGPAGRHEYTAVGDAVGVTARLEDLTKTQGYPVVCTAAVAQAVEQSGGLTDCGEYPVRNAVLRVYGWNPPLLGAS